MKIFLTKAFSLITVSYLIIIGINYLVDPAYLFHFGIIDAAVDKLKQGEIIYSPGDMDEGVFDKQMVKSLEKAPEVVIIGSSHVMYVPWEFEDYFVAGLSGAYVGDYYALIGLFEDQNMMPETVVFGIDPWVFMTSYDNGRHTSIKRYAIEEYNRINEITPNNEISEDEPDMEKIKELTSFSYFQSSIKNLRVNDITMYLNPNTESIRGAKDESVEEEAKILPNCRRVMGASTFATVDANTASAEQTIKAGSIYQLGTELKNVDPDNFKAFEDLVIYLQKQGVSIEFYLPSWYPIVYDYFKISDNFTGVLEVEQKVRELGKNLGITVHGSYDPKLCDASSDDFADWLHLKAEEGVKNYNSIVKTN